MAVEVSVKQMAPGRRRGRRSGDQHGESYGSPTGASREYRSWAHMTKRCYDPHVPNWKDYGGRGITVCDRWRDSYPAFLADMGRCPAGATLGRLDNEGPYTPTNCRWETRLQQGINTRKTRYWTLSNERISVAQMERDLALSKDALGWRLRRAERQLRGAT